MNRILSRKGSNADFLRLKSDQVHRSIRSTLDWRNPWLWLLAIIIAAISCFIVGPLTGVSFPNDLIYSGPPGQLKITGWTELLIFIVVIRFLLGQEAAREFLERIV